MESCSSALGAGVASWADSGGSSPSVAPDTTPGVGDLLDDALWSHRFDLDDALWSVDLHWVDLDGVSPCSPDVPGWINLESLALCAVRLDTVTTNVVLDVLNLTPNAALDIEGHDSSAPDPVAAPGPEAQTGLVEVEPVGFGRDGAGPGAVLDEVLGGAGADLDGPDLGGAGADLDGPDLGGAGADLDGPDLGGAGADLDGSVLCGAGPNAPR